MSEYKETVPIDEERIWKTIEAGRRARASQVLEVLDKARSLKGLEAEEVAQLMDVSDPELLSGLFATARQIKEDIYGKRLVLFAPLYISNMCGNECSYCAFRARNTSVKRRALSQDEIARETRILIDQGHKRILLVAGEAYPREGFDYILKAIDTVYATRHERGEIRRLNVNLAPLKVEEFQALRDRKIGTYQIFQETYHRETYAKVHLAGKKTDFNWRITAIDRAMQGNIDDVGIGVLFGLFDWRFEILAMMQHIRHLEQKFGVGPHTISVPRLEPAVGSDLASHPPRPVTDLEFRKIIAILRMAVPYTGIIMSTRETADIRRETFALGVSQISAGSRTNPGGYSTDDQEDMSSQFSLGDHRPLDEVIRDVSFLGYIPSFCTGCYRLGRTGKDFMDLAKPGEIKLHCSPNAYSTFLEYLIDYASDETRTVGEAAIARSLDELDDVSRQRSQNLMAKVRQGKRDVFC
ncbi:[FeFe] hydrogenase H-cluster radical SAM maturase HydG [bacterium]|nr:[FeFe] hydrogenase H-cluster radical SAM maturase HydG [bacterium]